MTSNYFNLKIKNKISPFKKNIEIDSDKSISIRSFLIGSICQGVSSAKNVLESEDVLATIKCLRMLGVKIDKKKDGEYLIFGNGLGSLSARRNVTLNFGNSGTLTRLLIGILSSTPNLQARIRGDNSLNKRSMKKLIDLMVKFGAFFLPKKKVQLPLKIISTEMPIGIKYKAGISAQLKSAVIFAALNSYGNTEIIEKEKSRDHTENMLLENKQAIKIKKINKGKLITVFGKKHLNPIHIKVPGDPSSAAFFVALTLLNKHSSIKIKNVGLNPTRIGFYNLLKKHGAKIKFNNLKKINNEYRGNIFVQSSKLKPIKSSKIYYVNSTDEYPILFIIAALTKGVSIFKGIEDLANKESNRIKEMQKILKQIGIKSLFLKNQLKIFGKGTININDKNINVPALGDHRICMSAFVLAILTGITTNIKKFDTVFTSSPSFLKIMKTIGVKYEIQK
jgi:3-phosphoshikimate 1-carboxyvinyltransferase|tara:strand:+ start:1035 stop:2384 length:1350 start_codon:yes stop_codon:yes gene_type:complete